MGINANGGLANEYRSVRMFYQSCQYTKLHEDIRVTGTDTAGCHKSVPPAKPVVCCFAL